MHDVVKAKWGAYFGFGHKCQEMSRKCLLPLRLFGCSLGLAAVESCRVCSESSADPRSGLLMSEQPHICL